MTVVSADILSEEIHCSGFTTKAPASLDLVCNDNSENFLKKCTCIYVNNGRVCPTFECADKVRSLARQNKSLRALNF